MIGQKNREHEGEVEYAECHLIPGSDRDTAVLRYMNDGYHLHVKNSSNERVTIRLNTYDAKDILNKMNDGTWEYTRCPECNGKP